MTNHKTAASDFNAKIIEEFRSNEGRVGGFLAGTPMILIHHIGAKSGIERVSPLACSPQADGRFAIVAADGGAPTHPDWYYNLKANPTIKVEVGTQAFTALAEELDTTGRTELWPKLVAESPTIGETRPRPRDRSRCSCSPPRTEPRAEPACHASHPRRLSP